MPFRFATFGELLGDIPDAVLGDIPEAVLSLPLGLGVKDILGEGRFLLARSRNDPY